MKPTDIIDILHREGCSCVISNGDRLELCVQRGVKDLFDILENDPGLLCGARIADKVVGKGAAALMILGGVATVYADVISMAALELFKNARTAVYYGTAVQAIINRAGTGICPVEYLCRDCKTAEECRPLIESFITTNKQKQ